MHLFAVWSDQTETLAALVLAHLEGSYLVMLLRAWRQSGSSSSSTTKSSSYACSSGLMRFAPLPAKTAPEADFTSDAMHGSVHLYNVEKSDASQSDSRRLQYSRMVGQTNLPSLKEEGRARSYQNVCMTLSLTDTHAIQQRGLKAVLIL